MAEFRKWKVDFQDRGNLASKQLTPPPGFDASATRMLVLFLQARYGVGG